MRPLSQQETLPQLLLHVVGAHVLEALQPARHLREHLSLEGEQRRAITAQTGAGQEQILDMEALETGVIFGRALSQVRREGGVVELHPRPAGPRGGEAIVEAPLHRCAPAVCSAGPQGWPLDRRHRMSLA